MFAHYHPLFLRDVLRRHLFVEEAQLFLGKWVSLLGAKEWGRGPEEKGPRKPESCRLEVAEPSPFLASELPDHSSCSILSSLNTA